jgi:hypothetical protein
MECGDLSPLLFGITKHLFGISKILFGITKDLFGISNHVLSAEYYTDSRHNPTAGSAA